MLCHAQACGVALAEVFPLAVHLLACLRPAPSSLASHVMGGTLDGGLPQTDGRQAGKQVGQGQGNGAPGVAHMLAWESA